MKLAIVTTHPVQYYAPVFQLLSEVPDLCVRVFYGYEGLVKPGLDRGFGQTIQWDTPLLTGYEYEFVNNISSDPGSHHFAGIDCPGLVSRICEWQADAVLVYGWSYKSHLQLLRKVNGKIPIYFRGDSTLIDPMPRWKRLIRRVYLRWIYKHVDHAFYVGTRNREYFEWCGLKDDQLTFAPHAVDNSKFRCDASKIEQGMRFREQLGIPFESKIMLFVGKLEPKKSPVELLSAFAKSHCRSMSLVYVGSGILEDEIRDTNIGDVYLAGFRNQSELPAIYATSDVLVLPSMGPGETWGLVVNEAMAAGCAIIVSDRVGCGVDLVSEANGWIYPAARFDLLAKIIQSIDNCPMQVLAGMQKQSETYIRNWGFEQQVAAIRTELASLASRFGTP